MQPLICTQYGKHAILITIFPGERRKLFQTIIIQQTNNTSANPIHFTFQRRQLDIGINLIRNFLTNKNPISNLIQISNKIRTY